MDKQEAARDAANYIKVAIGCINKAIDIMEENGLNLDNYPDYWRDFAEHPLELANMIITNFEEVHIPIHTEPSC